MFYGDTRSPGNCNEYLTERLVTNNYCTKGNALCTYPCNDAFTVVMALWAWHAMFPERPGSSNPSESMEHKVVSLQMLRARQNALPRYTTPAARQNPVGEKLVLAVVEVYN